MHTLNRMLTALLLCAVLVPPATFAFLALEQREDVQTELQEAIGSAVDRYRQRTGVVGLKGKGERVRGEQGAVMASLEKRKAGLRREIVKWRRVVRAIGDRYGDTIDSREEAERLIGAEKKRIARLLKLQFVQSPREMEVVADTVLQAILHDAADATSTEAVLKKRLRYLRDLSAADKAFWRIEALTVQREEVLAQYGNAAAKYAAATALMDRSAEQLEDIKRIMEEVHGQVLALQGELARIDARLKERAERRLLEKGLINRGTVEAHGTSSSPLFSWPVYGPLSAGFLDRPHEKRFGVSHYAIDIVAGEETPVAASAEGVVFLVRDGGAKGYTYILIGHRGGYATLYGHLLTTAVTAGQMVDQGQIIGMSGGRPGTRGAGPMTTGPHLHFEVIKAGVNIDPKSVLP